jgi:hypothetical protein
LDRNASAESRKSKFRQWRVNDFFCFSLKERREAKAIIRHILSGTNHGLPHPMGSTVRHVLRCARPEINKYK